MWISSSERLSRPQNDDEAMIHLVTVVGGKIDALAHMLEHYRSMGIESFFVNLQLAHEQDLAREQVEEITRRFGCGIASVTVGDWQLVQQELYLRPRKQYPSDWFLLADQDEFQAYPASIQDVIEACARWDYVRGCFVDRIARDGGFPPILAGQPIWDQYPLGGLLTMRILNGDPRKVVAVRGPLALKKGNHHAFEGTACPSRDFYIPIHHFKWTADVEARLGQRAKSLKQGGFPQFHESERFVEYCGLSGGRIDLDDPNLMIAECAPDYPHWEKLKKIVLRAPIVL
jgi:hypothetical protein